MSAVRVSGVWKKFRKGERQDSLRDLVPALFELADVRLRLLVRSDRLGHLSLIGGRGPFQIVEIELGAQQVGEA